MCPWHGHQPLAGWGTYLLALWLPVPPAVDSLANSRPQRNACLPPNLVLEPVSPPCCMVMVFGDGISKFTGLHRVLEVVCA